MGLTYERVRHDLSARLTTAALEHSERVADTAAWLASLYSVDVESARLAGLLHDWHREMPAEELVARARALGLDVTEVDEAVPYLLHGPVAEADLAEAYPELSDEVRGAVGAHTYGVPKMTPLAMVVYIADVIEPGRRRGGVDELREAAGTRPLELLFADVYAGALHHLIETRRRLHPQTVATWNAIIEETTR